MPRTPALRALGRLARGTFLRGGASVAAAFVTGAPRAAVAAAPPAVAIVGAGIAGLVAARVLLDHGVTPTVYDASTRIGGRMHSETHLWGAGVASEYCGELIDTAHVTMRALVKRFGLVLDDVNAAELPNAEPLSFFGGRYVPYGELQRAFAPVYRTLQRQLAAIGSRTTYARHTAAGVLFDRMTIYEWIARYVPGGHRSPLGAFIDVAYLDEYGRDTRSQSALNLIYWLGVQPDPNDFSSVGPSDNRFHIRGGNQRLPLAIAATLPPGRLVRGARLVALRALADGRVGLTFDGLGGERIADHAIVAIPFSVLRGVDTTRAGFSPRKHAAIDRLGYGANAKLVVQFRHRVWIGRGAWPGIGDGDTSSDLPYQSTWETTRAQPAPFGLLTNYVGESERLFAPPAPYTTTRATPLVDRYARDFARQLDRLVPHASATYSGTAKLSVPSLDPLIGGAYSCWLPGQYTTIGGYERTAQGNIHFAGEHTSVRFQGFMEGGAETGALAAREILAG
jgi:monoamine oxidase